MPRKRLSKKTLKLLERKRVLWQQFPSPDTSLQSYIDLNNEIHKRLLTPKQIAESLEFTPEKAAETRLKILELVEGKQ